MFILRCSAVVAVMSVAVAAPLSAADDSSGRWDREDGFGGIAIEPCGDALCAQIAWLRDSGTPARVEQQVLFDMRRSADGKWAGTAFNPEDGRIYAGTMRLTGTRLITRACILAGLVCRKVVLARPR